MIPIFFLNFRKVLKFCKSHFLPVLKSFGFFEKYLPQCYECDESFDYRKNWKSHLELVHQTIYYSSDDSEDEDTDGDDFENLKRNKLAKNKSISRKKLVKENINQAAATEQKDKYYDTSNETSTTNHNNCEK